MGLYTKADAVPDKFLLYKIHLYKNIKNNQNGRVYTIHLNVDMYKNIMQNFGI